MDVFAPLGADVSGGFPCPVIELPSTLLCLILPMVQWHSFTLSLGCCL